MGHAFVIGPCFACKNIFSFHPHKVPSVRVNKRGQSDPAGTRKPVCKTCIEIVNPQRIVNGLDPVKIPNGAYGPCDETEL